MLCWHFNCLTCHFQRVILPKGGPGRKKGDIEPVEDKHRIITLATIATQNLIYTEEIRQQKEWERQK